MINGKAKMDDELKQIESRRGKSVAAAAKALWLFDEANQRQLTIQTMIFEPSAMALPSRSSVCTPRISPTTPSNIFRRR